MDAEKSPEADAARERCVRDFFESLTTDEQQIFKATTLSSGLFQEVQEVDAQHKDHSISRKVSSALRPFIDVIEQYGRALDVFANSSEFLCPIWGGIRIVLHVRIPNCPSRTRRQSLSAVSTRPSSWRAGLRTDSHPFS
jgi:hypothetical protein